MKAFAISLPCLILACSATTPEARVKRAFEGCLKGVETGDVGAVIERLDPKFAGPEGMDRNAAQLFLMGVLRREKIGVTVLSSRIDAKGREALQTAELLILSRSGGILPQDTTRRTFLLRWVETNGTWRLRELQEGTAEAAPAG